MDNPVSPDAVLRVRRHEPTRLEGFVDASFAFAVTLLVISFGHVPAWVPEMLHALRGFRAAWIRRRYAMRIAAVPA